MSGAFDARRPILAMRPPRDPHVRAPLPPEPRRRTPARRFGSAVSRSILAALLPALAACTATGIHQEHSLRLHGGTHFPAEDVVEELSTGSGDDVTWGVEYVYSPAREKIGVEVGAFQSFTDGEGTNTISGFGLGESEVEKKLNEMHLGLNYPFAPFWGLETEIGLGLAYLDTTVETEITGSGELTFQDEGFGAYAKASAMAPISDAVGLGLDVRFLAPFDEFEDTQDGVTFDANLRQLQVTLFLALSW